MASPFYRRLVTITVAGLVLRVLVVYFGRHAWLNGDGLSYSAQAYLNDHGRWFTSPFSGRADALHPPLWTLVLTAWGWLGLHSWFSQQILACVIGTCTVAIVGLAGRQIGGERVGLIAAGIAALYAGLWVYERALLSETLMMLIIAVLIFVAYRFNERPSIKLAALLGVLAGLLSLSRSEQILVLPFVIAPLILTMKVAMWRRRVGWLALAVSLTLVVLAPWTIYNLGRLHRFVPLSDNFAGAVLQGNCPVTYYGPYTGYYSFGCLLTPQSNDQSGQGNDYLRLGLTYAEHHLSRLPLVLFAREGRAFGYWDPFQGVILDAQWEGTLPSRQDLVTNAKALTALGLQPNGATSYVPTATWVGRIALFTYWVLVTPAIVGAIILRRRRIPIYPLVGFVAIVAVAVATTYGETRYRAAAEVPIVLLAAITIEAVTRRWLPVRSAPIGCHDKG